MKYYWLTASIDSKIIGTYPQSETAIHGNSIADIGNNKITTTFIVDM